jgi:hypothetical protein
MKKREENLQRLQPLFGVLNSMAPASGDVLHALLADLATEPRAPKAAPKRKATPKK